MNIPSRLSSPKPLPSLARAQRGTVAEVEWHRLTPPEARRLRELGLDEGVEIELVRKPGWLGGPMACRIGRMTVALRAHVGHAIHVAPAG
jgi:ferrous iron transport protein A